MILSSNFLKPHPFSFLFSLTYLLSRPQSAACWQWQLLHRSELKSLWLCNAKMFSRLMFAPDSILSPPTCPAGASGFKKENALWCRYVYWKSRYRKRKIQNVKHFASQLEPVPWASSSVSYLGHMVPRVRRQLLTRLLLRSCFSSPSPSYA